MDEGWDVHSSQWSRFLSIWEAVSLNSWICPSEIPQVSIWSVRRKQSCTFSASSKARSVGTRLFSLASRATLSRRIIPFFSISCRMPVAVERLRPNPLDIPLEDGTLLIVSQDVVDDPALDGSDAEILEHGV